MYRYTDRGGERRTIYSYRLVKTDKIPEGKRAVEPLRDMEERIAQDLRDGIDTNKARRTSLNEVFDEHIALKCEIKDSTRCLYLYRWNKYIRDQIGRFDIGSIRYVDIKKFYALLIRTVGLSPSTVCGIHMILSPVFDSAIRDGLIRSNPAKSAMTEIRKSYDWGTAKRHALTEDQQKRFLSFVAESTLYRRWLNLFKVLLGTGMRIGEALGLRWVDCDFKQDIISINHNLFSGRDEYGKSVLTITTPKTKSSIRIVPMFSEVRNALLSEREFQKIFGSNQCTLDGYTGFIFCNKHNKMVSYMAVDNVIKRIIRAANADPVCEPLPNFSVHNLRHTFCTRLCENEHNLKIIQEIMGHSSISTTMDVYNEATKEKKIESFSRLDGKIFLGD